jgi:NAD(P)-dependent dehydrogenase (short-subunit alcohol dehydrogenase family)
MSTRFAGRVALVTGAARGIGNAIAEALLEAGAEVIALDKDDERLRALTRRPGLLTHHCDLATTDPAGLANELASLTDDPPSLIVHNAGAQGQRPFRSLEPGEFDRTFVTNVRTPWFLTQALVERLVASGRGGSILFISSLHSRFVRGRPDYSASKAAVVMLMRELAHELGPFGVRVNAISPGAIDTWSGTAPADPEYVARFGELIPLRRIGAPGDVAPIALALLDDEVSGYVTGTDFVLDGGLSTHNWLHTAPPD